MADNISNGPENEEVADYLSLNYSEESYFFMFHVFFIFILILLFFMFLKFKPEVGVLFQLHSHETVVA